MTYPMPMYWDDEDDAVRIWNISFSFIRRKPAVIRRRSWISWILWIITEALFMMNIRIGWLCTV